jgi:putative CRISPR-associated protein (TIGR02620 family)
METVVVTRHPALLELLRERGIVHGDVPVFTHVTDPAQIAGRHVVGVLPLHLAAVAAQVTEVPLSLAPELRGQELDLPTLREVAGDAVTYRVTRIK